MVVWLCSGGILGLTWVSGVKNVVRVLKKKKNLVDHW